MEPVPQAVSDRPLPGQAIPYRPDPQLAALAPWLGDSVTAADFPQTVLRWRNDRAAAQVGLDGLGDDEWIAHFGRFAPLPGNLPGPLALRYHGHQFGGYNPELGDGRGFTFAQLRDGAGRLLDLGTKGSGQTPWSRRGDGRLTLKGAVREILATELLEALGVNTSRTFSVIETGENLWRGDEPSPTRSAVLVRLSHGHIRIGTFQRLLALDKPAEMHALIAYCLAQFPGAPDAAPAGSSPAATLLHQVVARMADMAASYMVAGFVAAYFDEAGRYAFGRQPEVIGWNCGQLAVALRLVEEAPPLIAALERFGPLYQAAMARRWCWRLGVASQGLERDSALIAACEAAMRASGTGPDAFFHAHRGGRGADALPELAGCDPVGNDHPLWQESAPPSLLIDEVESIWAPIAEHDDWSTLHAKIAAIRRLGDALGQPPEPAGHGH